MFYLFIFGVVFAWFGFAEVEGGGRGADKRKYWEVEEEEEEVVEGEEVMVVVVMVVTFTF